MTDDQDNITWQTFVRPERDTMSKMASVALAIDFLKDSLGAISKWNLPESSRAVTLQRMRARIIAEAARTTGGDPAQIADPAARTPAQQQAMIEALVNEQALRMELFERSNFSLGLKWLDEFDHIQRPTTSINDAYSIQEQALLYFFATHTEVSPSEMANLTDAHKKDLLDMYQRFLAFLDTVPDDQLLPGFLIESFVRQENPQDAREVLDHLKGYIPDRIVMPNNKLANAITKGIVDVGPVTLEVNRRGARNLVETTCLLSYEGENVKLTGRQTFTHYDRSVYDAVSSLYVGGDPSHVITPAQVYRTMTNTDEHPSPQQLAAVTRSLDKMRFIRARINCTDEFRARRITLDSQQINHGEIDTYLLSAECIRVEAGGSKVSAYKVLKTPVMYEYASALGQVLTIPAAMMNIKKLNKDGSISTRSLAATEDRIVVKSYLLRRIEGMKGKNALKSNAISLYDYERDGESHEGLYSIAGRADADRVEQKRLRDDVEAMLSYWTAAGFIKGYSVQTRSRKIMGYEIEV